MEDILKWAGLLLPFLFGGGVMAWMKYFKESRQMYRDYTERELLKVNSELEIMKANFKELQLLLIPATVPEWRKNLERRYEYVNQNYEFTVLLPLGLSKEGVIGKTDEEIFGEYPEFIELMHQLDNEARKSVNRFIIRRGVLFPENNNPAMVIKEIVQSIAGKIYYVGRAYLE